MLDTMSPPKITHHPDRRQNQHNRRSENDRRSQGERRHDFREAPDNQRRTFYMWWRSITKARLGVDRRKQERRKNIDRRQQNLHSLLTEEEVSELLDWLG